jgi:hypothetical protein
MGRQVCRSGASPEGNGKVKRIVRKDHRNGARSGSWKHIILVSETEGHLNVDLYCDRFVFCDAWFEDPLADSLDSIFVKTKSEHPNEA